MTTEQPITRRERREAERRRLKTITMRPAVAGDAGSLLIPAGTLAIIEELAPGIRVRRFVVPDEG